MSGDLDVQDKLPKLQEAVLLLLDRPKPQDEHRARALRRVLVQHLQQAMCARSGRVPPPAGVSRTSGARRAQPVPDQAAAPQLTDRR